MSTIEYISVVTADEYSQLRVDRIISDDSSSNIQHIEMVKFADDMWSISSPALNKLMTSLEDPSTPINVRLNKSGIAAELFSGRFESTFSLDDLVLQDPKSLNTTPMWSSLKQNNPVSPISSMDPPTAPFPWQLFVPFTSVSLQLATRFC